MPKNQPKMKLQEKEIEEIKKKAVYKIGDTISGDKLFREFIIRTKKEDTKELAKFKKNGIVKEIFLSEWDGDVVYVVKIENHEMFFYQSKLQN